MDEARLLQLERSEDGVVVLRMVADENRFTHAFLDAFTAALDEVDAIEGPTGLVVTGDDRFFSNGLDLEGLQAERFDAAAYVYRVHALYVRLLTAGYPTAAAINGHAYAAAAMLAMCCDHRVMRADRGWWCLPEADLGLPFTPGMSALCASALPRAARSRAMVFAERFDGVTAAELGVVDVSVAADVVPTAMGWVRANMGRDRHATHVIKRRLHAEVVAQLRRDDQLRPADGT